MYDPQRCHVGVPETGGYPIYGKFHGKSRDQPWVRMGLQTTAVSWLK